MSTSARVIIDLVVAAILAFIGFKLMIFNHGQSAHLFGLVLLGAASMVGLSAMKNSAGRF